MPRKDSVGIMSPPPLLSPRASISSMPKKKLKKVPKESELDRHLREAQEEEARFRLSELER
jgi:hypothetical protein|tara:strand:+ start:553 stop:735 length:183 start_codon:yes stop_codon:yes gene_type:complete